MAPPLPNPAHGDQLIETTRYRVTESAARRGWRPLMARGPIEGVGKHREQPGFFGLPNHCHSLQLRRDLREQLPISRFLPLRLLLHHGQ